MTSASAPGKVILSGEHAVVYGRPAVALPVAEVQAHARVEPAAMGRGATILASDIQRTVVVAEAGDQEPLARIVRLALQQMGQELDPDITVTISSTIPIGRGLGSGAAISTAIVRALAQHYGRWISSRAVSDLVYQAEQIYHGTPSGIDNTVVAFEKPIFFVKDEGWEVFWVGRPFWLAIADTGIAGATREVVGDVRRRYDAEPDLYSSLFDRIGSISHQVRAAVEQGDLETLGRLMDENHALLQQIGVSSPELDRLVAAARQGGALGAKLSGAGWGGNAIALVTEDTRACVDMMLRLAGAVNVITTQVL
ncbi:MAG TPA: mevalonate kinase [Anaerolineae bacterium]|nr:mevalonate kinase [Anaerolineae bacterium]